MENPDIKAILARSKAHLASIAPRIREQYGVTSNSDIRAIDNAERELAECDNCNGEPCRKAQNRYFKPVIVVENGKARIPNAFCKIGERRHLRRECGRVQIPAKFVGKTFNDYEVTPDNRQAFKIACWFVKNKPDKSLYLFGECGTGKTFLAAIIAQQFLLDFKTLAFGDVPALLDEIKRTFDGNGNAQDVLDRYCNCDLLVLDDIGAGQITEWNVGVLYQIINARYNAGKPVVITSNFDIDGLKRRLTLRDDFTAKRITSRLNEMCTQAFLGLNDRRK